MENYRSAQLKPFEVAPNILISIKKFIYFQMKIITVKALFSSAFFLILANVISPLSRAADLPKPPLFVPWDIRPANSEIESDIEISATKRYHININFDRDGHWVSREIIGGAGFQIVTNDANQTIVHSNTPEDVQKEDELIRKGVYKLRHVEPGKLLTVEVWIEKFSSDLKSKEIVFHETEETCCLDRHVDRAIVAVTLTPGKYHLKLRKFEEISLPDDVRPSLEVTFRTYEDASEDVK